MNCLLKEALQEAAKYYKDKNQEIFKAINDYIHSLSKDPIDENFSNLFILLHKYKSPVSYLIASMLSSIISLLLISNTIRFPDDKIVGINEAILRAIKTLKNHFAGTDPTIEEGIEEYELVVSQFPICKEKDKLLNTLLSTKGVENSLGASLLLTIESLSNVADSLFFFCRES